MIAFPIAGPFWVSVIRLGNSNSKKVKPNLKRATDPEGGEGRKEGGEERKEGRKGVIE
jgi:hypothetical protein